MTEKPTPLTKEEIAKFLQYILQAEDGSTELSDAIYVSHEILRVRMEELEGEREKAELKVEEFQCATGLITSAGDPEGITPEHLEKFIFDQDAKVNRLRKALEKCAFVPRVPDSNCDQEVCQLCGAEQNSGGPTAGGKKYHKANCLLFNSDQDALAAGEETP